VSGEWLVVTDGAEAANRGVKAGEKGIGGWRPQVNGEWLMVNGDGWG
jgi:hypothetical protein